MFRLSPPFLFPLPLLVLSLSLFLLDLLCPSFTPFVVSASPWFCHDRDCPSFTTHNSTLYETRTYPSYTWAVSETRGRDFSIAQQLNVIHLYGYFAGYNEPKVTIDMTTPVVTRVSPGLAITNYTTGFFLPFQYQKEGSAPRPLDDSLDFFTVPANGSVAVRSFSGYATTDKALDQLLILQNILENEGVEYDPHAYYVATYDRPTRTKNRHNEVWLFLTNATQVEQIMSGQRDDKAKSKPWIGREQNGLYEFLNDQYEMDE